MPVQVLLAMPPISDRWRRAPLRLPLAAARSRPLA